MKITSHHKGLGLYYNSSPRISIRMMKLVALCLSCFLSVANVPNLYSQTTRLSLKMHNVSVEEVLNKIEESSDYRFIYNNESVNVDKKIDANFSNETIESILNKVFKSTDVEYTINDKQIILRPKGSSLTDEKTNAKKKIVKGVVSDSDGPIIGASISILGANGGTITDMNGHFSLEVPENATLQISFIGYNTRLVKVAEKTDLNIIMKEDTQNLDEVVVIGYGTQKKMNLTGSVSTISAEDITTIPVSNISNAMAGRMPGVFSNNKSGLPGVSSPITIRGISTPNNTDPTYVIDGVIREKTDFDALDPNSIESISVLKDAASAAVYGSRASNGVILVTTKRGAEQKPVFTYSGMIGTERPTRLPKVMNAYDNTVYLNNYYMYNGVPEDDSRYYTPDEQEYFKTHSTNWYDLIYQNPLTTQHNISVNGGSDKIHYYMSAGYYGQTGIMDHLSFRRYSFRSNVDAKVADNFTIGLDVDANTSNQRTPYWPYDPDDDLMNDFFRGVLNCPVTQPAYVNGLPNTNFYGWNPCEVINNGGNVSNKASALNAKLSAKWEIPWVKGLTASAMFNYRRYYETKKTVGKEYPLYVNETSGEHNHIVLEDAPVVEVRMRSENGNFVRKRFQ